jgi:hypothetical protein
MADRIEWAIWTNRYAALQTIAQRFRPTTVFRHSTRCQEARIGDYRVQPAWVVSRELSKLLTKAIGNLACELKLPNPGKTDIQLNMLPTNVNELGTIDEEKERQLQAFHDSFKRDPIEDDPEYEELLKIVDEIVDKKLERHPMRGGMGFCHVVWDTKKRVLKNQYNIDWRTPSEMNPHIIFD